MKLVFKSPSLSNSLFLSLSYPQVLAMWRAARDGLRLEAIQRYTGRILEHVQEMIILGGGINTQKVGDQLHNCSGHADIAIRATTFFTVLWKSFKRFSSECVRCVFLLPWRNRTTQRGPVTLARHDDRGSWASPAKGLNSRLFRT